MGSSDSLSRLNDIELSSGLVIRSQSSGKDGRGSGVTIPVQDRHIWDGSVTIFKSDLEKDDVRQTRGEGDCMSSASLDFTQGRDIPGRPKTADFPNLLYL